MQNWLRNLLCKSARTSNVRRLARKYTRALQGSLCSWTLQGSLCSWKCRQVPVAVSRHAPKPCLFRASLQTRTTHAGTCRLVESPNWSSSCWTSKPRCTEPCSQTQVQAPPCFAKFSLELGVGMDSYWKPNRDRTVFGSPFTTRAKGRCAVWSTITCAHAALSASISQPAPSAMIPFTSVRLRQIAACCHGKRRQQHA